MCIYMYTNFSISYHLWIQPNQSELLTHTLTHTHLLQLESSISLDPRPEYQRATINWRSPADSHHLPTASTTGSQCSSRLLSMHTANALLVLPAKSEERTRLETGTTVEALLLRSVH